MPTILQSHHVIEQSVFRDHELLKALVKHGFIEKHASFNRLYMPVNDTLADQLELSPHRGRTDSSYTKGVTEALNRIVDRVGGPAKLDDIDALNRAASQVAELQDTLKVALINGDLYTSRPDRLMKDQVRGLNNQAFADLDQYRANHPEELKTLRSMGAVESEWAAVTQSEQRITAVIGAAQDGSNALVRAPGEPAAREVAARNEFRLAVAHAQDAGRVSLSETNAALVSKVLAEDLPAIGRVPGGSYNLTGVAPTPYRPLSQRGFATMELLVGESAGRTLMQAGGLLVTVADGVHSARRVSELMEQGNPTAAQSELHHAIARNVGGWAGGASTAAALGGSGFVPAALVVGDAVLMSKAFEHGADLLDNRRIFHQTDKAGVEWQFTGRNWERQTTIDRTQDGRSNPVEQNVVASYEKSQELGAMANAKAVELALGKASPPQDPFNLPAKAGDQRGLDNQNWHRNPANESWERQVKVSVSGENNRGSYETQTATPERSQQLNQEALGRIENNIATGREAIAAVYLANHAALRAQDHGIGVPAAVEKARAKPDAVLGSDNARYQRNESGQWVSNGQVASGNRAVELELTNQMRQPSLERAQEDLAAIQARPAPTAVQTEQRELLHRYRSVGVDLNVNPDTQQAVELASQRTRQAAGITGPTMQQLQHNQAGQYGYDSPIVHYQTGADGVAHQVAITSTEDIRQALAEVRQQQAPSTATLATVTVTAPKPGQPAREQEVPQDDQTQRQAPSPQASVPVAPDFQHDHALLQARERTPSPHAAQPQTGAGQAQTSITDPRHAGHTRFKEILSAVHSMEFGKGIAPGPHSEKVAAALLTQGVAHGLHIDRVEMGADGQVHGIQRSAFDAPRSVSIDPKQAQGLSMQQHSEQLAQTLSPHLVSRAPAAERSAEQAQGVAAMSAADQAMFERIRKDVPAHIGDDHVALTVLNTKEAGLYDASKIGMVVMSGDRLWVTGPPLEGLRVATEVSQPAPPLQDTVQQIQAISQQREQQQELARSQQPDGPKGPTM